MSTVDERVERGAALLDSKVPGWRNRLDVSRLDMADPQRCVIGQLYGGFSDPVRLLLGVGWDDERGDYRPDDGAIENHGFEIVHHWEQESDGDYAVLTDAWKQVL